MNVHKPIAPSRSPSLRGLGRHERLIEDISDPVEETEVVNIIQEKKYCDDCKKVITAKSDLALPSADIGRYASVIIGYLWVALCLPYTKIKDYLKAFFGLELSTAGLSSHVITVSGLMKEAYEKIRHPRIALGPGNELLSTTMGGAQDFSGE
jgi:hypothetical protein